MICASIRFINKKKSNPSSSLSNLVSHPLIFFYICQYIFVWTAAMMSNVDNNNNNNTITPRGQIGNEREFFFNKNRENNSGLIFDSCQYLPIEAHQTFHYQNPLSLCIRSLFVELQFNIRKIIWLNFNHFREWLKF